MEHKQVWRGPQGFKITVENQHPFTKEEVEILFSSIIIAIRNGDFLMVEIDS